MFKSPENLTINNVDLSDLFDEGTDAYFLVNAVRGRDEDEYGLIQTRVPTQVGAYLLGKETGNRAVEVDFTLKGASHKDVRDKLRHIRDLMQEPVQTLVFDDDAEIYHRGTFVALTNREEVRTIYKGTLTFNCDPYRYFTSTKTYAFTNGLVSATNTGTSVAEPIYTINVLDDITYLDVFNEENYIRVGVPAPVDVTPIAREVALFDDAMSTVIGWQATSEGVDGGTVTGTMTSSSGAFRASSYGTGSTWHGPSLKRSIPSSPVADFNIETRFKITNATPDLRGRVEFTLLDDQSDRVAKFGMYRGAGGAGGGTAELRLGDASTGKVVVSSAGYKGTAWRNFDGFMRVSRIGSTWEFYVAIIDAKGVHSSRLFRRYSDSDLLFTKDPAQLQVHVGTYGTSNPSEMSITNVKVSRINTVTTTDVPYIARAGDVITIDATQSLIAINGEPRNDLKDMGGSYFDFAKGTTVLAIEPRDKVDATVTFRERFR